MRFYKFELFLHSQRIADRYSFDAVATDHECILFQSNQRQSGNRIFNVLLRMIESIVLNVIFVFVFG